MRHAVFADIHGNLEALEAAREYAQKHGLSKFMVLGNSVGYGANPNECLEWALQNASLHFLGNHEAAILDDGILEKFTDWARAAIDWTAERLRSELVAQIKDLAYLQAQGSVTLAHGTPHSPEAFHYLLDESDAYKSFLAFRAPVGFVGHSHVPCFFPRRRRRADV